MDMDMDIPLPDELEWLEANSSLHEDHHLDPPSPDPYPYSPEDHQPQSPTPTNTTPHRKRHRSDGSDSPDFDDPDASSLNEKRTRNQQVEPEEADEDWLRYSPPAVGRNGTAEEERVEVVAEDEERILSRYASEIDGDFIPVTAPSGGERVYAKICRVEREATTKKLDVKSQSNGLILEPINVLLQRVEQEAFTKALQASSEVPADEILPGTEVVHEQLWVDKYAPNSFTELLSDEQTNREVLLWLKQWDSCVFGSEIRSTSEEVLSALRRHSSVLQQQKPSDSTFMRKNRGNRWNNGNLRHSSNSDQEKANLKGIQDSWSKKSRITGPPEQKILLLCGPPGLGKTTLAHVAAIHCGYRVVEVNASDDRSSSSIEAKILDVVQMDSVMADSRPKCLVIDEIDGALGDGKGAVEVILKMISAEQKAGTGKENVYTGVQSGRMSVKKGQKTSSLLRPVICICNDLYAPSLRPLRQVAKVHVFVQPTVSRVVSSKEGMKTTSIALTALAEYTECDIRSCLNTLQFLNKKKESLNALEIASQVVGRKDMSRSVFDIWKEIFQKPKLKLRRKSKTDYGSKSNDFDFLYSLISNRGDCDVILDGIHENIYQIQYHDPVMQKTVKCLNILGVSDLIHQYIMRTQQMPLHAYQPHLAITIHSLIAQVQKPNIEWPKSYQRYRTILMEKLDMIRSWQNKIPPYISRHLSTKSFIEDSVSSLLHILSPPTLRPVALNLLSEKEKTDLAQLVSTMVSYAVTYKNVKSAPQYQEHIAAADATTLFFDPPIHDFIDFKGYSGSHFVLPLAVKQVLVHEVEKQRILQFSRSVHLSAGWNIENVDLAEGNESSMHSNKIDHAATFGANAENAKGILHRRQHNPSGVTVSTTSDSIRIAMSSVKHKSTGNLKKPSRDSTSFFDRFRKVSSKDSQNTESSEQKKTSLERDLRPLLFKFNEGFTNAVKRPVRMREFLL